MAVAITSERMTSDLTGHIAVPAQVREEYGGWLVSWLPGRVLTRNQAITAMTLAEILATIPTPGGSHWWPLVEAFAAELDLTGPDAADRITTTPADRRAVA